MDNFFVFWLAGIVLTWPAWIWFSIRSRKIRGEPLRPRPPQNAHFCERMASGKAHGNMFGNARNCLTVCVYNSTLLITPFFPFNLIAPYGWMGLEYRVPTSQVSRAEIRKSLFGRYVQIEIADLRKSRAATIDLTLKSPESFLAALGR